MRDALARGARDHRGLLLLVLASLLLRAAIAFAYWPGILVADSYTYIPLAFSGSFVGVEPTRPSGYPMLLDLIGTLTGSRVAAVTLLQQAMGLLLGVLSYALAFRAGGRRRLALLVGGVVLLEAELAVAGEYLMPEMAFALLLTTSALLVTGRDAHPLALGASGLLLGAACTLRTAGLFAVPVWLGYVLLRHRRPWQLAAALVMLALPLGAYVSWYSDRTGVTGLTSAEGWFLYGRVAELADCTRFDVAREARPLCVPLSPEQRAEAERVGPAWYVFYPGSPARRTFGSAGDAESNRVLREFSLSVIRSRTAAYAALAGEDFMRFFTSVSPRGRFPFPDEPIQGYSAGAPAYAMAYVNNIRGLYVPGYVPRARAPSGALRVYEDVARLPPIAMGLLAAAALFAVGLGLGRGGTARVPSRGTIAVCGGMALAVLAGSAATSDYNARYMTPVMPLLVVAGVLGGSDLIALLRPRSSRASGRRGSGQSRERSS